jgi:hypothetical protein
MAVAGCAASNGTALPPSSTANGDGGAQGSVNGISTGTAAVRFVHGSPDAGPVDICVDGVFLATNVAYKTVSGFYIVTGAVPHAVSVYAYVAGDVTNSACGSNPENPSPAIGSDTHPLVASVTPASNVRTSIVIGGTVAKNTLTASNITTAAAAAINLSTPIQPSVLFVFASPTNPSLSAGYFNPSATSSGTAANTAVNYTSGTPAAATKFAFKGTLSVAAASLPAFASSTGVGIGFFASTTAAPTVPEGCLYAGKVPTVPNAACSTTNGVDTADVNDVLPYTTDNDYLLSVFVVDGPQAAPNSGKPELIGAYDPITLGY